jgi:hypothetical protein
MTASSVNSERYKCQSFVSTARGVSRKRTAYLELVADPLDIEPCSPPVVIDFTIEPLQIIMKLSRCWLGRRLHGGGIRTSRPGPPPVNTSEE